MRSDIIIAFCEGKKPKELIDKNVANKKTIYYYHSIFNDMKEQIQSDEFSNEMIKLLLKLRIKER
jgi:hypothetical protein